MITYWGDVMKKHELLVPAGNMECLYQAVSNGCDAVYLASKSFGARKFARNFTNEELIEAIKYCHLYGVKVFVTMNTLIKNNEVESFLEQVRFLHKNGVDALIVQDFGMICLLREMFPNLEIHASTQANISSKDVCRLYHDLGVKRVVFAREVSIDEINSIDVDIEKEAFIHGALCISYSGCCLMSSMLGGRSGNRGECAGCCRLPYTLKKGDKVVDDNKYLLSTKELNTTEEIDKLLDSSIYSFKIEGRMKSPLYVGFITRLYRKLIDKEKIDLSFELDKLKTIFNREFTKGRMFNEIDSNFMNTSSPNHIGLEIGKVLDIKKDKIKIKLDYKLNQGDAIRFLNSNKGFIVNYLYDKNMKLTSSVDCGEICYVDNKVELDCIDIVSKTQDHLLEKEFEKLPQRKVKVSFKVKAFVGDKLIIEISDGESVFCEVGSVVEKAISSPTTRDNIEKQLTKLGNTPFVCSECSIEMDDDIFISLKELNEYRRCLVDKLVEERENRKKDYIEKEVSFEKINTVEKCVGKSCFIYNIDQFNICNSLGFDRIYINNKELYESLKDKYKNVYYVVPRCSFDVKNKLLENSLVSDYGIYNEYNVVGNYTLNVTNIYTAYYLRKIGFDKTTLSVELTDNEIEEFIRLYNDKFGNGCFEVLVYGRVENMIIKGNILNIDTNDYNYYLEDAKKRSFPVYYDGVNTHILNYENKVSNCISCIRRYDFYVDEVDSIKKIVNN